MKKAFVTEINLAFRKNEIFKKSSAGDKNKRKSNGIALYHLKCLIELYIGLVRTDIEFHNWHFKLSCRGFAKKEKNTICKSVDLYENNSHYSIFVSQ